jgi:hypothetical protein
MDKRKDTLRILMTGLCAFVPGKDIEKYPKNNQMRVLLVESTTDMDLQGRGMNYQHEQHVPVLMAPYANVDTSDGNRRPDLIFRSEKEDVEWAVFYLAGQDLRVKGAKDHRLEIVVTNGAGCGCTDDDSNRNACEWVADFAAISPGSEYVDKACLEAECDPAVVARVELWEGKIFTEQIGSEKAALPFLWKYKIPDSPRRGPKRYQSAAHIVGFEAHFKDVVELRTSYFGKKDYQAIKLLIPKDSGPEGRSIVVWVKNMPWADILGAREPEGYRHKPDIHFAHLYKVCLDYDSVNVPHFYKLCRRTVFRPHAGNPNCQPVRTAPNTKA